MTTYRNPRFFPLALLLTPALLAQGPTEIPTVEYQHYLQLDDSQPKGDFITVLPGDFDGDRRNDVALLNADGASVMLSPGFFDAGVELSSDVSALVVVPGNDRDDLLVAGSQGIHRYSWNETATAAPFWTVTPVPGTAGWNDIEEMCAMPSTAGQTFVHMLDSDRQTLRALVPINGVWSAQSWPGFLPVAADDMTSVQFNGAGAPELAVVAAGELRVYTVTTSISLVHSVSVPGGIASSRIAPLFHIGGSAQWLAWVATWPDNPDQTPGPQSLSVYGSGGLENFLLLPAGGRIEEIVTADHDLDGKMDLFATQESSDNLALFLNDGITEPSFSLDSVNVNSYGVPFYSTIDFSLFQHSLYPKRFAVADLDGDGDIDVVHSDSGRDLMWVYKEERIVDQSDWTPSRGGTTAVQANVTLSIVNSTDAILGYTVFPPALTDPPEPGHSLYLEYLYYSLPDPNATVNGSPFASERVALDTLPSGSPSLTQVTVTSGFEYDDQGNFDIGFSEIVFATVAVVSVPDSNPNGRPSARYPAKILVCEALDNTQGPNADYIRDILQGDESFDVIPGGVQPDLEGVGKETPCFPTPWNTPPGTPPGS